ncbi:glycosyltransferase, partial [Desulfovibrio sp.]|uniref:glycosyltransferase n=1 Tax=Desulfovibrio sp. TaxID=885 RepID=UPI0023CE2814
MHIAYGIHNKDGYFVHGLASMHSLMKSSSVPVVAHLLHDGTLGVEEQAAFQAVAGRSGGEAVFHDIAQEAAAFPEIPALERFSRGCLFRLLLPRLLPEETVVYLDSDVIATGDAAPLLADALAGAEGPPLWAALDTAPAHRAPFRDYIRAVFGDYAGYFNARGLVFKNAVVSRRLPAV